VDKQYFVESLEKCRSYGDIFDLVKKSVKKILGLHRAGLILYLENLPVNIGAYYQVGSNGIVLNKSLISLMGKSLMSRIEFNSLIFFLLLHEYLHSLGFLDEEEVRRIVYEISVKTFGKNHPAAKIALEPPLINIPAPYEWGLLNHDVEIVKDFERIKDSYIA
jgi:hypothetical protein